MSDVKTAPANAVNAEKKPLILFYCKDCEEIVETNKLGKKYVYTCKKCGTKNVAFGTKASIFNYFKLEDDEEMKAEKQKLRDEARIAEAKKVEGPVVSENHE